MPSPMNIAVNIIMKITAVHMGCGYRDLLSSFGKLTNCQVPCTGGTNLEWRRLLSGGFIL